MIGPRNQVADILSRQRSLAIEMIRPGRFDKAA